MALMGLKGSSSFTVLWKYEVFLSFRGEDNCMDFVDNLNVALKQKGISVFKTEVGERMSPKTLKAIEESRIAIVILSKNYASSTWCLDQLAKIVRCRKETGLTVLPIFYDVDPSDVGKQTGAFAQALVEHEKYFEYSMEKLEIWRDALKDVANLSGWHLNWRNRYGAKLIQDIVKVMINELSYSFPVDTNTLVGMNDQFEELKSQLALELSDVRIIGIWGMGGMGKTALARFVYGMVCQEFEACGFIPSVRECMEKHNLIWLQQQCLEKLLMVKDVNIKNVNDGVFMIRSKLHNKKILLVLDDVSDLNQLKMLVGEHDWFGLGSRVIITTRDMHLLKTHAVDGIYKVRALNDNNALQLFSLKAFRKSYPDADYVKVSQAFVHYSGGIPFALEFLGSFLFGKGIDEWKIVLDRLKCFPERNIMNMLKISFDGLLDMEKEIFLNIACFFNHMDRDNVIEMLDCLDLHSHIGLKVLIDKSLVELHDNRLWMHNLLQEMGQEIIRQESPTDPGRRSRLWLHKDIDKVLTENTGTKAIEGIVLKLRFPKAAYWYPESFLKMPCLKFLIIDNVHLMHDPKHLPKNLRFLDWRGYPSKSLPSSFQPNELIELHLSCSNIEQLWKGTKFFDMLKFIQLKKSQKLIETPDLSNIPNLEKLVLEDCINLPGLHQSIGIHKRLTLLNLKGCKNLESLPSKFEMESLEILILSDCSKVKRIPEFGENMRYVSEIYLDGTAITKLPSTIEYLTCLASLKLTNCKNLISLPSTFFNVKSLKNLDLVGCSKLGKFLDSLGTIENLEKFDVTGTAITPMSSSKFSNLGTIENLEKFDVTGTAITPMSSSKFANLGTIENLEKFDVTGTASSSKKSVRGKDLFGIKRGKTSYPVYKAVDMTIDSSGETKSEIEEIWYEASQTQPEVIEMMSDGEAMQSPATPKPQFVVFEVEAFKIAESSRQMEFQIEDIEMEPEAIEQHGSEADQHKEAQLLMQGGLGLTKPPKDEDWENTKEIYLMNNELSILPENPMCPKLSALFLQRNYKLRTIPPSFFDYMPALQILNLSRTGIKSLPDSLIRLVSLKRLFLNYCPCFMILSPKVGELKQLEVLDLEGTEIMHLPQEIKKLTNLTCLEVSFYGYTSDGGRAMQSNALVPCGVIFALSQLEELNIDLNPDDKWWDAHVEGILSEVCNLKRLNALKFYFPRVELLRYMQWNSPISLSHFRFTVGHHVKRIMSRVPHDVVFELERWERCLKYINGGGDIPREIKKALQHATAFFLDRHATAKSLSNFGTQNMKKLKCCVMGECKEVQVIIDEADAYEEDDDSNEIASDSYGTEKIVLGSLEYLYVYRMKSLRSLWNGQLQWKSLFLLKSLTFHTCPQLTTIFVPGFLDKLCKLEELTVKDCPSIRSLVSCEITAEHKTSNFLPNLKRIALHYMPELDSISSGLHIAPKLEWSSFYDCNNLKNPFIEGISSKDLKKIEGEESWWKELNWSNGGQDYYDKFFVPIAPWDCSVPN